MTKELIEIKRRFFISFGVFLLVLFISSPYIFRTNDSQDVFHHTDSFIEVAKDNNALLDEIKEQADGFSRAPENAYVDKVWKKTPGRYGRTVNIEKSYQNMKKKGSFDENLLIYDYIEPKIALKDLEPAPIYRGHPEKEAVALMVNVSWGTEYIPTILDILAKEEVKATFFIDGSWAKENAEYLEMIEEKGHLLGNHAYSHPNMRNLSQAEMKKEITQTEDIIEAITKSKTNWFAPPSGSFNQTTVEVAHEQDMQTILWTVDTIDWKDPTVGEMLERVRTKLHPGALILMHPTKPVAEGLEEMIKEIKEKDYELMTVEQLLDEKW